jgi:hypothetical protein
VRRTCIQLTPVLFAFCFGQSSHRGPKQSPNSTDKERSHSSVFLLPAAPMTYTAGW